MRHNGGRRPDEILAEIERTRTDMDATLHAIEHRLTPGQLVDQGIDYLRNSGATEFVANLGGSVKHNPLPVALVGIGLAWLMAAGKKPGEYTSHEADFGPSTTDKLRSRASDTLDRMRERASSVGQSARQQVDRAKGGMDYMLREQPLAVGAIGLAIGAFVAAMAPRTRPEDALMGEARDRLLDQAAQAGKEKLGEAQRVASAAKEGSWPHTAAQEPTAAPSTEASGGPRDLP
jgi:ElaB/YqjD/DUF883 family membrane-anchored ribosome-binding protein